MQSTFSGIPALSRVRAQARGFGTESVRASLMEVGGTGDAFKPELALRASPNRSAGQYPLGARQAVLVGRGATVPLTSQLKLFLF